jgi:acyl-CoA hydrolase
MDNAPQHMPAVHNFAGKIYTATHRKLIMTEDLNAAGRLFGGRLMEWVDEAAALFCMTEIAWRAIVTKKISEVIFNEAANLGDVLEFVFRVRQAGHTSITIEALVIAIAITPEERKRVIVQCDLVFVSLDEHGKPRPHGYVFKPHE